MDWSARRFARSAFGETPHEYGRKSSLVQFAANKARYSVVSMIVKASGKHHVLWLRNNQQRDGPAPVREDIYEQVSWTARKGESYFIMLWGIKKRRY